MSLGKNQVDSHIVLNVERIDLNERDQTGDGDTAAFERRLHGAVAEAFEHLKRVRHPNVCAYTNLLRLDRNVYLLVSEGYSLTMGRILTSSSREFAGLNFTRVVQHLMCGLHHLHSSGIAHTRLTPDCVAISDEGLPKISGYGAVYLNDAVKRLLKAGAQNSPEGPEEDAACSDVFVSPFNPGAPSFTDFLGHSNFLFRMLPFTAPELVFFNGRKAIHPLFWFNADIWSLGVCILLTIAYALSARGLTPALNGPAGVRTHLESVKTILKCQAPDPKFIAAFLFMAQILLLVNEMDTEDELSSLGLDLIKMVAEQVDCGHAGPGGTDRVTALVREAWNRVGTLDLDREGGAGGLSLHEAIELSVDILTGGDVLRTLIRLDKQLGDTDELDDPVADLKLLLATAHDCLFISNRARPRMADLMAKQATLKLCRPFLSAATGASPRFPQPAWHADSALEAHTLELPGECHQSASETRRFIGHVGLENVLYYWTLLGNEPENLLPFEIKSRVCLGAGHRTPQGNSDQVRAHTTAGRGVLQALPRGPGLPRGARDARQAREPVPDDNRAPAAAVVRVRAAPLVRLPAAPHQEVQAAAQQPHGKQEGHPHGGHDRRTTPDAQADMVQPAGR